MNSFEFKQPISKNLFFRKYGLHGETSAEEVFRGVAEEVSSVEEDSEWKDIFYNVMLTGEFIPAGRILANARPDSHMKNFNNCFTIDIEDSMEGIFDALKEDALISKMGGGVGFNVSKLRPRGAFISKGGESSGVMSFLEIFDASAKSIHTGGGRRCLPYDAEVMTDFGITTIDRIARGDRVLTYEGYERVTDVFYQGEQETIKLHTVSGDFECTPNHRMAVWTDIGTYVWKEAQDLTLNDSLVKFKNGKFIPVKFMHKMVGRKVVTYDIEVENRCEFIANNFLTHNSAHIAILNVDHPDIEEFITYKQGDENKRLTQFNISVGVTDKFIEAVKQDADWDLVFDGKVYKTVKAKDLYDRITKHAWWYNEPGALFLDTIEKENNGHHAFAVDRCNP